MPHITHVKFRAEEAGYGKRTDKRSADVFVGRNRFAAPSSQDVSRTHPHAEHAKPLHLQRGFKDKAKLSLGSMVFPTQTRRWLQFIEDNQVLGELAQSFPRLIHKIYRPYLSNRLDCADRVDALISHYGLMFRAGFRDLIRRAAICPVTICEFFGKSGAGFRLELTAINVGHREGEFSLRLISDGESVYTVTFILLEQEGEHYIKIGCLQGTSASNGSAAIKRVTRDLHGCRPKNLLVSIVRDIGDYFGCRATLLISNQDRICINRWRRRRILSNYDQTWLEMGAVSREDGDFELSCTEILKTSFDSIPSKKRSEAKKRSALLNSIFDAVRIRLDQEKSAPDFVRHRHGARRAA